MMADEIYVERDDALVRSSVNKSFDELQVMSETEFRSWAESMREEVARLWRDQGVPPISGFTIKEIESQFYAVGRYDVDQLLVTDELTGRQDCALANSKIGSACRSFFPNMGQTKDIADELGRGYSQWDFFTDPTLFESFLKTVRRHFKRDGFYAFSRPMSGPWTGRDWIEFHQKDVARGKHKNDDFWLEAVSSAPKHAYASHPRRLWRERGNANLPRTVLKKELEELRANRILPARYLKGIEIGGKDPKTGPYTKSFEDAKPSQRFLIREYKKGQRVFPKGFRFFQAGLVLSATNFSPVVAKYLYQHYTDDIKGQGRIVVYDPSAGFGARLLGALAAGMDRQLHYVGTDPNPDNWLDDLSRYEVLADFYRRNVNQAHQTTCDLFKLGSEVIGHDQRFKKYRGKVDLVFTSPPYFDAEGYSEDENQSSIKFPLYDDWREGFLRPTLETAVEWLKPGRPLIWNIADVADRKRGSGYVPLEYDSKTILEELGMRYETKLKYVLSHSPGANRLDAEGIPETKNFCMIGGRYRKYEPLFVFRKPAS